VGTTTTTTTTPLISSTMLQGIVGSGCSGCSLLYLVHFFNTHFTAKAWERIWRKQFLLDNLYTNNLQILDCNKIL
jgi:hypothetical protein